MISDSCSDIMGKWRFSKDSINKMTQIIDKTKIIERGGILCGTTKKELQKKKIDLVSECKGTRCNIRLDPSNICNEQTIGLFHTILEG